MKIYINTYINQVKSEARQSFSHNVSNSNSIHSLFSDHLQELKESRFTKKPSISYNPEDYISHYLPEECVTDLNRFLRRRGIGVRRCLAALILYSLECGQWNRLTEKELACIFGYKGGHADKTARLMMKKLISLGLVFKRRRYTTKGGSACNEYKVNPFFFQKDSLLRIQYSFDLVDKNALSRVIHKLPPPININDFNYKNITSSRGFPEMNLANPYGRAPQIRHEVPHRPREFPQKGRKDSFLMLASLVGKAYQVNSDTVLEGYSGLSRHDKYLLKSDVVSEPAVSLKPLTPEVSEIFDKAFPEVQNKVYTSPLKVSVQPVEKVAKPNGLSREEIQEFINRTRERYFAQTETATQKAEETH